MDLIKLAFCCMDPRSLQMWVASLVASLLTPTLLVLRVTILTPMVSIMALTVTILTSMKINGLASSFSQKGRRRERQALSRKRGDEEKDRYLDSISSCLPQRPAALDLSCPPLRSSSIQLERSSNTFVVVLPECDNQTNSNSDK